ncbi:hypothetical protein Acr_10g0008140 [Actinidia rufa]|uniref:Uncharacterized protein n=1 Tax=Actinidia rufa TaxID=165716 RepID=A0A7J0FB65_9ERIC|nr:hypothetical protein Acr_10g0008140 [Actinidia rufa]
MKKKKKRNISPPPDVHDVAPSRINHSKDNGKWHDEEQSRKSSHNTATGTILAGGSFSGLTPPAELCNPELSIDHFGKRVTVEASSSSIETCLALFKAIMLSIDDVELGKEDGHEAWAKPPPTPRNTHTFAPYPSLKLPGFDEEEYMKEPPPLEVDEANAMNTIAANPNNAEVDITTANSGDEDDPTE